MSDSTEKSIQITLNGATTGPILVTEDITFDDEGNLVRVPVKPHYRTYRDGLLVKVEFVDILIDGQPMRPAFTLIELLVVIAIIGVLAGLLLPAVQKVREAGNNAKCKNNLKQIGLAFFHHTTTRGYYPPGGRSTGGVTFTGGVPDIGAKQRGGWGFHILPYLEEDNVYRGAGPNANPGVNAVGAVLKVYFCPSRRSPSGSAYRIPPGQAQGFLTDMGITDFAKGVPTGLCDYAASNFPPGSTYSGVVRLTMDANNNPIPENIVKRQDVTAGLSNLLVVGEKMLNRANLGGTDDDIHGYACGFNPETVRSTATPPSSDINHSGSNDPYHDDGQLRFGAAHLSGFNAAFGDGSVHVISYSISTAVFTQLGDINNQQPIQGGEW